MRALHFLGFFPKPFVVPFFDDLKFEVMQRKIKKGSTGRMLVVGPLGSENDMYISTMNAIFSAQKLELKIDSVLIGLEEEGLNRRGLLQQAASLTDGIHLNLECSKIELLGGLLLSFAVISDPIVRQNIRIDQALMNIDLRPSCFCHGKRIDEGHVCSVCLSGNIFLHLKSP